MNLRHYYLNLFVIILCLLSFLGVFCILPDVGDVSSHGAGLTSLQNLSLDYGVYAVLFLVLCCIAVLARMHVTLCGYVCELGKEAAATVPDNDLRSVFVQRQGEDIFVRLFEVVNKIVSGYVRLQERETELHEKLEHEALAVGAARAEA